MKQQVTVGANRRLTLADVKLVASHPTIVSLSPESLIAMERSFAFLKDCTERRLPIYGLNTNFGDQVGLLDSFLKNHNTELYQESIRSRQQNIIKSLACGLGENVSADIVKVTMLLRAHCLSQGYSGVTLDTVTTILSFLNADILPIVHRYGSIGASGDLIPLATIAAALLGENIDVQYHDKIMKAPEAIELANIKKLNPEYRDGLALINGTSFMTAIASIAVYDLNRLFKQMLAAIAMSLESMLVVGSAYHPMVHQVKKQQGEQEVNQFFIDFWKGSQLVANLEEVRNMTLLQEPLSSGRKSIQDYYSLRSVPQGFGPFYENLRRASTWVENEMNSVNDNPIVDLEERKVHHSANFMGYYITDACDFLKINIAQASTWIHALLANMVHARKSHGLPINLVIEPHKNNGFRSVQLLAAALAVQNRKFAQAHQAYSLPTEGDNQDVNSLGTHAALDLKEAVANLERLTAILFLAGAQALEIRGIKQASIRSQTTYQVLRQYVPHLTECHPMMDELNRVVSLLRDEEI